MADSSHIKALDCLRGIASLMVVLLHLYAFWPEDQRDQLLWLNHTPLRILINARLAVIIFFVLSGFVLALPFYNGKALPYGLFLLRRLCRIYLPFVTSIALAVILCMLTSHDIPTKPLSTDFFWINWPDGSDSWPVILRHLAMTGATPDMILNHNMWTLVIELRIALIFPLLLMLANNAKRAICVGLALFVVSTGWLIALQPRVDSVYINTDEVWISFLITIHYAAFFLTGILLARFLPELQAHARTLSLRAKIALWAACAIIGFLPHYVQEDIAQGAVAFYAILMITIEPQLQRMLSGGPLIWLGTRSYSLYLVHLPVMLAMFHHFYGKLSFGLTALISFFLSLLVTEIFYLAVEKPSIEFGRMLTRRQNIGFVAERKNKVA